MAIDILILGILTIIASVAVGYFWGTTYANSLYGIKKCGWEISAWKSVNNNKYYIYAVNGSKNILLSLYPTGVDFDLIKNDDEKR